ncbi:hypothetical protein D0Z00_002312 [Geotrichum galactomycetum]|uniref:Uncharacterized protein n=1 Tax=Geotrichum galactomycetum TaxID=27317 RepID=A0ACB6V4J2_9ASCO|nr:hypothetical protein D0Z00_002312 [Geotrichum candidum]
MDSPKDIPPSESPNGSHVTHHDRTDKWLTIYGANIIIVEGIYALYDERVLALTDLKVFIDSPIDICLARRLARDIVQRDRSIALSIQQWSRFVKPNFEKHLRYTMYNSDIRVPGGIKNTVVIDLLMSHVKRQLQKKSIQHLDNLLSLENASNFSSDDESNNHKHHHPEQSFGSVDSGSIKNHIVLEQTNQLKALHTSIIGYQNTSRSDFIFSFNRVASLLLTKALDELDSDFYESVSVTTPTGSVFAEGLKPTGTIASVIMVRGGGGCYHTALRKVLGEDGRASSNGFVNGGTGSILIQSDARTGEPRLHSLKLPTCIDKDDENHQVTANETKVFLLDTQLSSGVAAIMGVSILLDHGIKQKNVTVVTYMASDLAVKRVLTAYPDIKLVVASTEQTIYPKFVENIYFGTTII